MKRRVLMTMALTLALLVSPLGQTGMSVLTASSNNSSGSSTTVSSNNSSNGSNSSTENNGSDSSSNDNSSNDSSSPAVNGTVGAEGQVTTSEGASVVSTVAVNNITVDSVAITTSKSSVYAAASLKEGQSLELSVTNFVGEVARQALNNAAGSAGAKVVSVMDLTLNILEKNGDSAGKVTQLASPVEFTVAAPAIDGVNAKDVDFAVLRLHDGAVTLLPDMDSDPATITFATDQFSAYAIVYGPKGTFDSYKTSARGTKDNVPKTGDSLPIAAPITATVCLAAAAIVLNKKKEA